MYIGVDYYPEHRPQDTWERDAQLMQAASFNVVRMAEFAWVNLEPEEGRFEFGWLDRSLALLAAHGISAILGTPTAVMPAWVARKYPETLATQANGQRIRWASLSRNTRRWLPTCNTQSSAKQASAAPVRASNMRIGSLLPRPRFWPASSRGTCHPSPPSRATPSARVSATTPA